MRQVGAGGGRRPLRTLKLDKMAQIGGQEEAEERPWQRYNRVARAAKAGILPAGAAQPRSRRNRMRETALLRGGSRTSADRPSTSESRSP